MVRRAIFLILAVCGISRADTGFTSTVKVKDGTGTPSCVAGQITFGNNQVTCSGQTATVTAGGSGIVSPGTFTWTNNFGASFSTITAGVIQSTEIYVSSATVVFDAYILPSFVDKSTVSWANSNVQFSSVTANVTYVFNPPESTGAKTATLTLYLWTGAGSHTAAWPATVHWSGGSAPTITSTANKYDIVTCKYIPAIGPISAEYACQWQGNF